MCVHMAFASKYVTYACRILDALLYALFVSCSCDGQTSVKRATRQFTGSCNQHDIVEVKLSAHHITTADYV
jgi:hypothetical protein